MVKKIFAVIVGLIVLALTAAGVSYLVTQATPPDAQSSSARWLADGPMGIAETDLTFTDTSRPVAANGDYPGASTRTLNTTVWYPASDDGAHPLIIYSHGFMSNRQGGNYMARALASHGYVVVAPDYPLTHGEAPGDPLVSDVINQPADVSFLIDSMLALDTSNRPFAGQIDETRIGVAGISLGGLTSTLAAFHPTLGDSRIKAAVSIAGPANMFTPTFFAHADVPLLMIAGTVDAIVDYSSNAAPIPDKVKQGALLSIADGSHTSFVSIAEPALRWLDNPDNLGCTAILANISDESTDVFANLVNESYGIVPDQHAPPPCQADPLPTSIHPGRQHMMTQIAVLAFFESHFAQDATARSDAVQQLEVGIATDFAEASFHR